MPFNATRGTKSVLTRVTAALRAVSYSLKLETIIAYQLHNCNNIICEKYLFVKDYGNFRTLAESACKGYFSAERGGNMLYNRKSESRASALL